jgi:hypothetical protein
MSNRGPECCVSPFLFNGYLALTDTATALLVVKSMVNKTCLAVVAGLGCSDVVFQHEVL